MNDSTLPTGPEQDRRPCDALIDSVAEEMASAFGWSIPPSEAELEAQYAATALRAASEEHKALKGSG